MGRIQCNAAAVSVPDLDKAAIASILEDLRVFGRMLRKLFTRGSTRLAVPCIGSSSPECRILSRLVHILGPS